MNMIKQVKATLNTFELTKGTIYNVIDTNILGYNHDGSPIVGVKIIDNDNNNYWCSLGNEVVSI